MENSGISVLRAQCLAQLVLKGAAPAEPSFPASPASETTRCFTPKLTRGHRCHLWEGHPARALSQSWQTLPAVCVCPALRLWPPHTSLCPPSFFRT